MELSIYVNNWSSDNLTNKIKNIYNEIDDNLLYLYDLFKLNISGLNNILIESI
jgi:hypothetical protein